MEELAGSNLPYADKTVLHPIALVLVIVLGISLLVVPKRWATMPFLITACFVSSAQRITILSMDFNFLRIMIIFGIMRILLRHENRNFIWKPLDVLMIVWAIIETLIYTIQIGDAKALTNRLGYFYEALGMYFLFRCLIRVWLDVDRVILGCICISIPVAVFFLIERSTGRNVFSVFGGVPEITYIREGRLRCQGAYSHAILAGCFWASLLPLMVSYWWKSARDRVWVVTGLVTSSIIVICCASSTPVMAVLFAILGGLMFYVRFYLRWVRWFTVFLLLALHLVMNKPVWHLIARVSAVGGSTGWHRYNLIDQAINHFDEWWLFGIKTTAHWGEGLEDVTNQYVFEGVVGGIGSLFLFVMIIVYAYKGIGLLLRFSAKNKYQLAIAWGLGVSLFVHCMNFIGVSYFGQIFFVWYLLLAMIGSLSPVSGMVQCRKSGYSRLP